MIYTYNLRPLFLYDGFEHSGCYDVDQNALFWTDRGVRKALNFGKAPPHRVIVQKILRNEREIQAVIVALMLAGIKKPKQAVGYEVALKRLKGCHTVVLSNTVLTEMHEAIRAWHLDDNASRTPPPSTKQLLNFLKACDTQGVRFAPHPDVDDDLLVGVHGPSEALGVINGPNWFPYPVGIALRNPSLLLPVRVKAVVYTPKKARTR